MTRLFLLVLTLLFTSSTKGQVVETKVINKMETLAKANVDTFLVYSYSCNGGLIPLDSCLYEEEQILFWQQDGQTFLQKFDYCKNFKVLKLDTLNPLTFYLKHKRTIGREDIKPPTYFEVKKSKIGFDTIMNSLTVSHSCFHQFTLNLRGKVKEKSVNTFNLNFVKFDNGKMNIYRRYNQRTKLNALTKMTANFIKTFNNVKLKAD